MIRQVIVAALIVLVSACATSPVSSQSAPRVVGERFFNRELTTPADGKAQIIVTRDRGFMGSACTIEVYCDGTLAAGIRTGEQVILYVAPGEHIVGAKHGGGICGGGVDQTDVIATLEKARRLRIAVGQEGDIKVEPSAF